MNKKAIKCKEVYISSRKALATLKIVKMYIAIFWVIKYNIRDKEHYDKTKKDEQHTLSMCIAVF